MIARHFIEKLKGMASIYVGNNLYFSNFENTLARALKLDHPYSWRPNPIASTTSAVLALFALGSDEMELLLTKRSEQLENHKGQISFPGGMKEGDDFSAADVDVTTALREAHEEVGVVPDNVRILGKLPPLETTTRFSITPVVGVLKTRVADFTPIVCSDEVAEVFWAPLSQLLNPNNFKQEMWVRGEQSFPIDVFYVGAHRVWGATGSMIRNLMERLGQSALDGSPLA